MPSTVEEQLEEAQKRKEARDAKRAEEARQRQLDVLLLEEQFEKELGGARGLMFEIIEDSPGSAIVVKLADAVIHKRFMSSKDFDLEAALMYVTPSIVWPSKEEFSAIVNKHPSIAVRCANALATLFGVKESNSRSKF